MAKVEQTKFVLRLPASLHKKIKHRAKSNNSSMNTEMKNILTKSISGTDVQRTLDDLVGRLEEKKVI